MIETETLTIRVRRLREDEIGQLARAIADEATEAHIANRWREQEMGYRTILVAEVGGQLVGTVSFSELPQREAIHLFALEVAAAWRNQGVGTRLVEHLVAEARRRGLGRVRLEVRTDNRARRLYHRLGFRRVGAVFTNTWYRFGEDGSRSRVDEVSFRMVKRVKAADYGQPEADL